MTSMTETEAEEGSPFYSSSSRWAHDVFLNFRGADTRAGFTSTLNKALTDRGIRTFFDDDKLRRGQQISHSLLRAIEGSRFAVVVFSPNYAASSYCLDELVHIMSCCKGEEDRLVLPVFYEVDPSQVRHQGGAYGEALERHQRLERVEEERLRQWREALYDAANLSGWHIQQGSKSEYTFIRKIIGEIFRKINRSFVPIGNHLVGMEPRARNFIKALRLDSDEGVVLAGIWGMGGVGKTTLARTVFNLISGQFEATCFLADVRRRSHEHGLVKLQEALVSEIAEEDIRFEQVSVSEIIPILKHRLHRKKVLLIVDDVDELDQLESLAGRPSWFGPGSRIIITTRDKNLLTVHGAYLAYEAEPLNEREALELLCWKALEDDKPDQDYVEISERLVSYSCGHPLVLEIIGSYLFGKQIDEWHWILHKYKRIPTRHILEVLSAGYDNLDADVKTIFLDIACCFNGYELEHVKDLLLNGRGIHTDYGFQVLISKSFIKIDGGQVRMHELVEDLGREIVRQESPKYPAKRSRLWLYQDIVHVLQNNKGTAYTEIMKIDLPRGVEVQWDGTAFGSMKNLKILEIVNSRFSCVPTHLPKSLRVLNCKGYFG